MPQNIAPRPSSQNSGIAPSMPPSHGADGGHGGRKQISPVCVPRVQVDGRHGCSSRRAPGELRPRACARRPSDHPTRTTGTPRAFGCPGRTTRRVFPPKWRWVAPSGSTASGFPRTRGSEKSPFFYQRPPARRGGHVRIGIFTLLGSSAEMATARKIHTRCVIGYVKSVSVLMRWRINEGLGSGWGSSNVGWVHE